jgi:hypothetical protein
MEQRSKNNTYDLGLLYKAAFGYTALPYPMQARSLVGNPVETVKAVVGSFKRQSMLGTEFFMPIKIAGYQLPGEPVINIQGVKNIVRTPVAGTPDKKNFRGTVKEQTSLDDYRIRIRGIIISEEDLDEYPADDIRQLRERFETLGSVEISSQITDIFNISLIAIETFDLRGIEGAQGAEAFEISGYSDEPEELELIGDE